MKSCHTPIRTIGDSLKGAAIVVDVRDNDGFAAAPYSGRQFDPAANDRGQRRTTTEARQTRNHLLQLRGRGNERPCGVHAPKLVLQTRERSSEDLRSGRPQGTRGSWQEVNASGVTNLRVVSYVGIDPGARTLSTYAIGITPTIVSARVILRPCCSSACRNDAVVKRRCIGCPSTFASTRDATHASAVSS